MVSVQDAVKYASALLYCALLAKLFHSGLFRIYRWFTAFVAFEAVRFAISRVISPRSNAYAHTYFLTQPVAWILLGLVVFEMYRMVLRDHRGIASLGRRVTIIGFVLAVVIAVATVGMSGQEGFTRFFFLARYFAAERIVTLTLFVYLLLITAFLAYFPIPLVRNVIVHTSIFGLYFFSKASLLLARNVWGDPSASMLNLWGDILTCVCGLSWILLLTLEGQKKVVKAGARWTQADEERILANLVAVNRSLSKVSID